MKDSTNQAGFIMAKIHQTSGRIFARLLREAGIDLNPSQGRILFVLWQSDGVPIQDLVKRTALQKSTLTSMLDRLEEQGYLKREASKTDRRKVLIWRTQKDRDLQQQYNLVSQKMESVYFRNFSTERMQRFEEDLRHILDNLETEEMFVYKE